MDFGLILAATTDEPGQAVWLLWKVVAALEVGAGLTFVIFVHELGHFLVAKACGVKCEKFYVGFDFFEIPIPFTGWKIPRSLVKFQWGETEYGIGSLPLGGYVKMLGQDDDPRNAEAEAARIRAAAPSAPEERVEAIASGTATEGFVAGQSVEKLTNEALAAAHHATAGEPVEAPVPATTTEGKTILLDPRSYPAKSVPARMAIISAGVIMNLIFAVILAAVAFRMGVEEMPAIVGGVTPGGPAWEKGIQPGSKILEIGRGGKPYEHLRFSDLMPATMLNGTDRDLSIFLRKPDGQEAWYTLRPSDRFSKEKRPILGIAPPRGLEISDPPEPLAHRRPQSNVPLQSGDRLIKIAGQEIASGQEANAIFAQNPTGPIAITVERRPASDDTKKDQPGAAPPERLEVTLQPKPLRELGLAMKIGPIAAIREGSPAADAGFHVGDVILKINDQPVGDPLALSQRFTHAPGEGEALSVVVSRKDRQDKTVEHTLKVTPEPPLQSPLEMAAGPASSIESIGVAFTVTNEVAEVDPAGPAGDKGLQPGDIVTKVEFPHGPNKEEEQKLNRLFMPASIYETLDMGVGGVSWITATNHLQAIRPENVVKLTWTRGKEQQSAELQPRDSATLFDESRGLTLNGQTEVHVAKNMGEAFSDGLRESKSQVKTVATILQRLVTLRVSPKGLSGPPGIIGMALSVASEGIAPLLLFLTMLSANLAVLNFMPIPALDGGHMVFLAAEWIRGKPVDERLQIRLTVVGVICLLTLMVFATAMDIGRYAEWIKQLFS